MEKIIKSGFVKNINLLNETYQVDDLLDFSASTQDFKNYLGNLYKHSLVGLVGDFGMGKSTMLYQLEKEDSDHWLVFDAWAFPNRKDLWEGFVLDVARKVSEENFNKARKDVDGHGFDDIKGLIKVVASGANYFFPGAGILGNLASLFKSSPARRVFEFKEIFIKIIKKAKRDLFIVLEDVDRSGKEGSVFLETLKQFIESDLKDYKEYRIIFIVPIGTKNFEGELAESFKKSLDYSLIFRPKVDFSKFINEVFVDQLFVMNNEHWREQLNELLRFFLEKHTIRDIKRVLRHANQNFLLQKSIENFNPDPRMTVLMEIYYENGEKIVNATKDMDAREYPSLSSRDNIYNIFCVAMAENIKAEPMRERNKGTLPQVIFVKNHKIFIPLNPRDPFEKKYRLQVSDLYLKN